MTTSFDSSPDLSSICIVFVIAFEAVGKLYR